MPKMKEIVLFDAERNIVFGYLLNDPYTWIFFCNMRPDIETLSVGEEVFLVNGKRKIKVKVTRRDVMGREGKVILVHVCLAE